MSPADPLYTVLQLAAGEWTVWALCDESDCCPVLDTLVSLGANNRAAERMIGMLTDYVPEHGPPYSNTEKVKPLGKKIYEFRVQPKKGPKIRVLFFRVEKRIVCTEAFDKRNESHQREIENAASIREGFVKALACGRVERRSP